MIIIYIVLGVVVVAIIYTIVAYNKLVALRIRVAEAWSDIEVQLKRRYDLIPNLVEAVKGYAGHEKDVFMKVAEARTLAMGAQKMSDHAQAENMLNQSLKSLFAVSEAYPVLRASENFQKLQDEVSDTENKIQAARRFYNGNVMELNVQIESFPSNTIANFFNFVKSEFFDLEDEAQTEPVQIKF